MAEPSSTDGFMRSTDEGAKKGEIEARNLL